MTRHILLVDDDTLMRRSLAFNGDLVLDPAAHLVTLKGQAVDLSPREFALLHTLALEAGHVVTVDDLLARVWGAEYAGEL